MIALMKSLLRGNYIEIAIFLTLGMACLLPLNARAGEQPIAEPAQAPTATPAPITINTVFLPLVAME